MKLQVPDLDRFVRRTLAVTATHELDILAVLLLNLKINSENELSENIILTKRYRIEFLKKKFRCEFALSNTGTGIA